MRKKKEMSLLIVITMLLMIMAPMPAVAEATNWADYANASAPDDYEVSGYVYTIKTATGLAWLASQVNEGNAFSGMTFQLSGDIDLSAHEWTPIGNNNKSFSGTFDGCNKKISGLAIGSESNPNTTLSYIGLFGEVWPQGGGGSTPEIKNLTIETSGIYSDRTGKPFAEIGILAGRTKATITNCKVSGNVVGTNSYLGGLLGEADGPVNISECSAAGNITLTADAGICGGLIGYGNSIDISKSYAAVGVTYTGDNYAGGLVGHLENINSKVSYCYATGNVVVQPGSGSGHIYACGGLVGFLNGQLLHCYARGDVSGNNKYTGGLIGESNGSVIIAYASGKVTCNDDSKRGAVIGYSRGSSLTYWNDEVYEGANQGIGNNPSPDQNISTGKHQADMQGADFAGLLNSEEPTPVWKYVSGVNDGYPVLIGVGDGTAAGGSTGPTVTLTSDSAGTAGYKKITGLTEGKIYKVTVDPEGISPETMYTKADGSLTANEADKEALGFCVTAITGLTNGTTYKVEEYNTPPAGSEDYTITKSGGSFQVAGAGTYASLAAALAVCTEQGADNKLVIKLGDGSNPLELNACKNSNDNNLKAATYTGKVNFTITSNTTDGFTIPNGITATFEDLAITTSVDSPPFSAIKVMQGGILNIEEGTSITPHFAPANPRLDLIANVGELNINGGTITGDDNTGLLIRNNGILKASGGTITASATGNYGIAISSVAGGNITVSGNAVISASKSGIAAEGSQSTDQIVINGGTVEATGASGIAIMTRGAKVDVTAGTVRSTDTSSWACAIGDISSNVINSTITISGGTISCAGDTAIRVGNTSLGTVNVSGGTIKSAGDKTLLLFQHASTPDNAKFVVHGVSIYRHNEAFVSIKGVVDPADNNNRVLTGANKNDATVTATNIASGKSFIGWMSDSARTASISTTNGATITSLTTGDNAAVSDIYLKVGVLVSAPTVLPTAGSFTDTDNDANQIGGTITWTAANPTTDITGYKIYWGSNATTKLAGNSAVVYTVAGAASTSQAVADNTDLPVGATHFLIYSYNTGGDSASCLAIAIADGGPAQAVTLAAGSLGAAGDGKITNLTSGSRYKVSVDGASKYVKADGTLSDNEADAANLIGTQITGLSNGKTYKVEEYSPLPANPEAGSTITFAGMDWICISTEPCKLVLKDLVRENEAVKTIQYNVYNQDVYTGSTIDTWLNGTFLDSLGDDADNIQAVDWNCGPDSNISSIKVNRKVGLLNYVEVFSNNAYNKHLLDSKAPVAVDWWLLTPRGFEDNNAYAWYMLIGEDGKGYGNPFKVTGLKAIRPLIYLKDGFTFNLVGEKYEAVAPAANVILSQGSLGLAGDGKITNLVSGSKYKVSVDGASKYVKADGTLSDNEADAAALIGTEITGLTNGKNYKVEEYTGGGMSDADAVAGAKAALDESDITYSSGDSKTSVTGNFTMPLTGENGTTITWTENPESSAVSINPTTGVVTVTRPANGNGDAIVTLRATITRNGQSDNKDLTITIKQQTGLKLTVPDFSIENQTIAEGVTKQITLSASGSKLIVNQVEQTAAIITYSYIEVEDTGNIAELFGSTLTLSPPADGSAAVKIKATAAWAEGGSNLTASRIASFTVRNEGNPPCCCIVTPPAFSVNNQTIPYDEDKVVTLNASGAKLIGNCQIPGHAAGQINYTYTILSGSLDATGASIASINGNQLTLNPTIAGTYAIMIQTTASANNKTAGKTASFAVSKQPGPAAADCKCDISAPVLAGGNITIPAGANNANLDLIGQLTAGTITGGCQLAGHANAIVNHVFAIKTGNSSYNTAGASLNGTSLTVTNSGSVTVIATAFANSKLSQTAEAMYNVSDADVSAVENQITALPLAGSDTPGTDDTEINNAAAAILAAKTAFENLSTDEKEQLSLSKRSKLDTLINRLGVLQTGIDASQAGAAVTATGLETAVNTTNELNAGSNVNITLAVQAEANSSNADETAADGNLIITSAGSNQNLSSAFDIRLLKTVTESSGNVTTENISEADAPVYVTLELPAGMQGGRDYKVYHVHTKADGSKELEIIEATYNANAEPPSISFWIREFSTIKIAYTKRPGSSYDDELYGGNTGLSASTPAKGTEVYILVNGKAENAGTATTAQVGDQTVTTVLLDPQILEAKLSQEGMNAVLTIPVNSQADVVIGQLTGQMIKNLENKQAVVEIKTETAVYTLPAQQINIDAISVQLGQAVALKDITVQIEIAKAADETAKMVENSAKAGEFTIVAPPVAFKVQCSFGDKTVSVNSFNNYVERTIAIPEGADPNKITTGVAVEADGSIRHVPTQVIQIDGRYYAKINSLTNSSYAVIWHPLEFKDVDKHWAKAAVNDMGSRMVISGINQDNFEPDRDITRAEFAAIVVQALGLKPGSGEGPFSDVNAGEWYSGSIQTGSEYKIISGYGNEKFGPTDKISREQAMSMIARAMNITGLKADFQTGEAEKLLAGYSDAGRAAEYAKNSLAACVKTGIITGKNKNMIAPKDNISRAEVAVMVQKLLQKSKLI